MERDQKRSHEVAVFCGFITAAHLPIDVESVASEPPPYPDVRCTKHPDGTCRFELAEILWEDPDANIKSLAHGLALSERASEQKAALLAAGHAAEAAQIQTWGGFGRPPLASILQVLQKKCQKRYETDGHPLSLLLYYERDMPLDPFDRLFDWRDALYALLARSQFADVWVYHHNLAYTANVSKMADGGTLRAPLLALAKPEDHRRVIGHLAITKEHLAIALDAEHSQAYHRACEDLDAAREHYRLTKERQAPDAVS